MHTPEPQNNMQTSLSVLCVCDISRKAVEVKNSETKKKKKERKKKIKKEKKKKTKIYF